MKPFVRVADFLKKCEEKRAAEKKEKKLLAESKKSEEPYPPPYANIEEAFMACTHVKHPVPEDASTTTCWDFFKKNNSRFHNDHMMETLLVYKCLTAQEDLTEFRLSVYPDTEKNVLGLREILRTQSEMAKTVEMYKEVLREPYPDEEMRKLMTEFTFWTEFLKEQEKVAVEKLEEIGAENKWLMKKLNDAEEKLEHFLENRKDEKPRIWFWQ